MVFKISFKIGGRVQLNNSDRNGRIGRIQINPADREQGVIEIAELTDLLESAIQNKLQLSIFNSCDGLGLALK